MCASRGLVLQTGSCTQCLGSSARCACLQLMIRRVGDHEALSAGRASEMGDGTLELREVPEALAYVEKIEASPDLLTMMCGCIVKNKQAGIYDGCKTAVELATKLAGS